MLAAILAIVVTAPVMGLLHFVARKSYGALSDGTVNSEDPADILENMTPDQMAKWAEDSDRVQRAAQAEVAERAAKDRVTRRF